MTQSASLLASLLLLIFSTPILQGLSQENQNHGIITPELNPFDGGAVGSCEVPTTSYCDAVDYPVPTTIARLAAIIENGIRREVRGQGATDCAAAYKQVLCRMRFPRCQDPVEGTENQYSTVSLNSQDCSTLTDAGCIPALTQVCMSLTQGTVPATGCRPVSELLRDYTFTACDMESLQSTPVTEWMLEYMKFADRTARGVLYMDVHCGQNLATFMCNSIGRCTEDGNRIEIVNSYEKCNDVLDCFGDDHEMFAEDVLTCDQWPQEHLRVSSSIPSTAQTTSSSTQEPQGSAHPVIDSSVTLRQSVTYLTAAIILALFLTSF